MIGICKEYEGCGSVKVKECDKMNDADNVRVAINKEFLDELAADFKENNVRTLVDSVIHIASGQEFPVFVNFASAIERMKYPIARVHVSYRDGLEVYNEDAVIDFSQYGFLSTCRSTRTVNGQRIEEDVVLKG